MPTKTLLLIDTFALAHRAYHAFPSSLSTKRGEQTNAIYGFASMLLQVLKLFRPDYIICAYDSKGPTLRHQKYEQYKANRPKTDPELSLQLPKIAGLIDAFKIPVLEMPGYEADDIIGSVVHDPQYQELDKIVVTGDRDLLQLLNGRVKVYLAGTSFANSQLYDETNVVNKLGFSHEKLIDYKALRGDPSDNIPGVAGIGEKSAADLLIEYGDLDNIYRNLDKIRPNLSKKLQSGKELAYISRDLAQIVTDLHLNIELPIAEYADIDFDEGRKLFEYYEFRSLVGRLLQLKPDNTLDAKEENIRIRKEFSKTEITTRQGLMEMLENLKSNPELILYIPPMSDIFRKPDRLYFATQDVVYALDVRMQFSETWKYIESVLRDGKFDVYDAKNICHALYSLGITDFNFREDIMLMDYLMAGGGVKIDLESSLLRHLDIKDEQKAQAGLFEDGNSYTQAYHILLLSGRVKEKFFKALEHDNKPNILSLYQEIEKPLIKNLVVLERNGINLDKEILRKFNEDLQKSLMGLEEQIFTLAGQHFNISSPKQLSEVLFEKLKLPKGKRTKTGSFSTNERILNNYVHDFPIVAKVLEFRELFKLKSTYTTALINQVNSKTGRIHTSFNQAVVATGRLSSTNPNLQNIPINTELGQTIRTAFSAAENKLLVSFDYSQQELRLLAHLSHEKKLTEAFVNNIDIHAATAAQLFNVPVIKVSKEQRRVGKTVNFGVIYGISAFGLADRLKISNEEAQVFIDTFFTSYPRVKVYFEELKAEARNKGYIESILGRRRSAGMLNSPNYQLRQAAEREIINFPLQGSAADIMKLAMIKCQEIVDKRYSKFAKMVLQVHDELIFEVSDSEPDLLKEFQNEIKNMMVKVIKLSVPVIVDSQIGKDWGEI